MSVCQKLGMILVTKKWAPKLKFLNEIFFLALFVKPWFIDGSKKNPLSMLILGQKYCFLRPTIFKIPLPNWYYCSNQICIFFHNWNLFCSIYFWITFIDYLSGEVKNRKELKNKTPIQISYQEVPLAIETKLWKQNT